MYPLDISLEATQITSYKASIKGFPSGAATAKSLQSCPTLCDPRDSLLLGSSVPGILQAKTLEWVAISFFNAWKWKVKVKSLSCVQLLATSWTAAYQAPLSMGFSRQEYWSGVPLPSPQVALVVKNSSANAGDARDLGSIPRLERSLGGGHGNPLQYSYLENSMDRGTVHGVAKSWMWLSAHTHKHTHTLSLFTLVSGHRLQRQHRRKALMCFYVLLSSASPSFCLPETLNSKRLRAWDRHLSVRTPTEPLENKNQ